MVVKGTRPTIPQEVIAVTPKDYLDLLKIVREGIKRRNK
jgi:hypothetical protein